MRSQPTTAIKNKKVRVLRGGEKTKKKLGTSMDNVCENRRHGDAILRCRKEVGGGKSEGN